MGKALKELALITAGVGLGLILLYFSSLVAYHANCGGGYDLVNGFPYWWNVHRGLGADVTPWAVEPMFALDVVFWVAVSLAIVEVPIRIIAPYFTRELKLSS